MKYDVFKHLYKNSNLIGYFFVSPASKGKKNALVPISFLLKRVAPPSGRLECLHFFKNITKAGSTVARWHGG